VTVAAEIDLADLDRWVKGVPHEWFKLLRREAPVYWQAERRGRGFWSLTRYDDVVAASKDYETFSAETGGTSLMDLTPEQVESRKSMLDTDPPRHTRLRNIVNKGFTARVVNAYEGRIRAIFREILADAFGEPEFDFTRDVAVELPMRILCELMGTPVEDRSHLVELGDRMLGNTDPDTAGEEYVADRADLTRYAHLPFSSPAALEMFDYASRLAAERRREPRDDVTTRLVEAEIDGDRLSGHEFNLFFLLLITAGNETTRHAMSNGLHALLTHLDERDRLLADPSLVPTAVDEILRWAPSLHHFRRTATRDVELHGTLIRAGDKVVLWYVSANRDEAQFPDPFRFDVGRSGNRHVAFGMGPHFCLGAHLARLELRIWLEELLPYLDRIELAGPPVRLRSNFFHGIKALPVRVS
jgi:cytochrome P450